MPISDEIIELAPVKKTKTTLIIMFVIMGVLLASAAAFLVLYLLKPSAVVGEGVGSVVGVEITESTTLFSTTDGNGDPILTASVGSSYTVYATVNVKGDPNTEVTWKIECEGKPLNSQNVFAAFSYGLADSKEPANAGSDAETQKNRYTYYCTFTPNAVYAGKEIILTAVSKETTSQSANIKFTVVEQATKFIFFTKYRGSTTSANGEDIINDTLKLPCYSLPGNNKEYRVSFTQKGESGVKKGEYAEITVNSETKSDAVSAVSSNKDVIDNVTYNYNASTLAFRLLSAGKTDIIVTANINNAADEVVARLHIEAQSSSDLELIDSIYFTDKPVTADFYKDNWTNAANNGVLKDAAGIKIIDASKALTLAYNTNNKSYNNVLAHVVLVPFSLQCSKTGEGQTAKFELKNGWQSKVKVTSSDPKICNVTSSWINELKYFNYGLQCNGLSSGTQCKISVSDSTIGAVAAPCDVNLNIIAPNTKIEMSFGLGDKTYNNDAIIKSTQSVNNAIAISQSENATLTVSYEFLAPANTDATTMVRKEYVGTGYSISLTDPNFATIKLKDATIALDKETKFDSNNFAVALQQGQTTTYIGTATFDLTVGDSSKVKSGLYTLTFKKSGMTVLTNDDPDVECAIRFNVTAVAKKASFIDDDDAANAVITDNGARVGKFVRTTDKSCDIYIQNQRSGVKLADAIKFAELFTADQGEIRITGTIDTKTPNSTFDGSNGSSYENLVFNGNDQSSYNNNDYNTCQAELTINAIAEGTSNSNIGTFKINVYVLNAIDSIGCITPDSTQPFEYRANYSGLYFAIDAIEATRTRPSVKTSLQPYETTFSMQYLSGGWYYDFDETASETEGNKVYGITFDGEFNKVFEYYANNNRIYFVADPFLVGFNCKVTLSSIRIEYKTVSPEYYDQAEKRCYRNYSLVRHADSVALFSDKTYQTKVDTNKDNNYVFELNQYDHGALYASAIVQNPNGKDETEKEIVVSKYDVNAISACEGVYMNVPATIGLASMGGTPYSNLANTYTAISFDAPPVAGTNKDSQNYVGITLRREYNQADQIGVIIIVKNAARPIESMELYDYDEDEQERKLSAIQFGKFDAADDLPYTKTFYVRIKYAQAKVGTYVYFMGAELTLPSYLRLSLNDAAYLDVADKYTIGQEIVSDEEGGSNIDKQNVVYTLKCTVQLIPEASQYRSGKEEGDRILLKCAAIDDVTEARAKVATGIKSISYIVDGDDTVSSENNNVKDLKIVLDSANAADKSVEVPFVIHTFADEVGSGYAYDAEKNKGIAYNLSDLDITGPTITGLRFGKSTSAGDTHFAIIVDVDNVRNIVKTPFAVNFVDKASGSSKIITIRFTITVESDIYDIDLGSYSFTTNGKNDGSSQAPQNVSVKFNGDEALLQPNSELISKLTAAVYTYDGATGSYTQYTVGDVAVSGSGGAFTLAVKNNVLTNYIVNASGRKEYFYLGLTYAGETYYTQSPISIATTSEEIALESGNANLNVTDAVVNGKAGNVRVNVTSASDTFDIAAYVFNRGTLEKTGTAVTYKLYPSAADRNNGTNELTGSNAIAVIDSYGTFSFVKPHKSENDRTIYYRAYFTDVGRNVRRYIDVNIDYTVSIASVAVSGIEGGIFNDGTITLYYIGAGAYTQIDLTDFITVKTAFDGVDIPTGVTISIASKNESKLAVFGKILYPTGSVDANVAFDVTVDDGIVTPITKRYYVHIITVSLPQLSQDKTELNVVTDETVGVVATISDYSGLEYSYSVSGFNADIFDVQKGGDNSFTVAVKRDYGFDGSEYAANKTYKFTVVVSYTADADLSATINAGGSLTVSKDVSLKLKWADFKPEFEIYSQEGATENDIGDRVDYSVGAKYFIRLVKSNAAWYNDPDWTYTAKDGNGIVSVGAFNDGVAEITVTNKFGTAALTVKASAYGKNVSESKNVTFNYGDNTTAAISLSTDGGASYTPIPLTGNAADVAIDFGTPISNGSAVAARKFRYDIDATSVGATVGASDIKILYGGDVTVGAIQSDEYNKFYVIIIANDVTKFTVSSTITVGGRTYYKDAITLDLTATEPDIKATATAATILPDSTAQFGVILTNNGFIGDHKVTYEIVDGSDFATVSATGVLTPKKNNTVDTRVVVAVKVSVTDGVFKDMSYTVEKAITITGIALPSILVADSASKTWNDSVTTVEANGTAVNFGGEFKLSDVVAGGKTYSFANATYVLGFTAPQGYTASDYTVNGNSLTVNNTNRTRAGGRFTLTVSATLGGSINVNKKVYRVLYIDVIPTAKAVAGMRISARKGSYDVKSAVALYTGTAAAGQIAATDAFAVSYTLANSGVNVNVNGTTKSLSSLVSVSGSNITLKESIPATGVVIQLVPTVTMKSGAYAGTSFTGETTSVSLNGFSVSDKEIGWDSTAGKNTYQTTDVASLIPTSVKNLGTPIIEVRAMTNATKVIISNDGTSSPTISVDKTINVQQTAGGSDVIVKLEFIVSFVGSDVEYYGVGGLAVMPITPTIAATLNGENSNTVDITAGASFGLSLAESHGLEIVGVTVGGIGDVLTYVTSGANIIFTAADVTSSATQNVNISYNINSIAGSYTFTANISPRGDENAFTVTNETVRMSTSKAWVMYTQNGVGGSTTTQYTYGFVSEWIASESNPYTIPYYLSIRPYSGSMSNAFAYIKLEAFDAYDNRIGNAIEQSITSNSSYYYIYLGGNFNSSAYRIKMTFGMSSQVSQFTIQYQSRSSSNSNMTTSKIYRCSYSDYVPVTLDVNAPDATISSSLATVYYTNKYSTITTTPTRPGYDFAGWYFNKECTQSANNTVVYGYSNTVYAKWNIAKYTVKFNYNGGKVGSSSYSNLSQTFGQNYVLPATNPTQNGYSFAGWYTAEIGGNRVTADTVVPSNPTLELFAHWVAKTYTVTFKNAVLDAFSAQKTVTFAGAYGTLPTPTKTGYSFGGWYTSDTAQTNATAITSASEVSIANNHDLFAKWDALSYVVTLNADGGTISGTSAYTVHFETEYGFMNTPTRPGYTFNGWYTEPDGAGAKITNNTGYNTQNVKVTIAADHSLYAYWTADEYSVSLSAVGATGAPSSITVVYGGTYAGLEDITPVKTGYTFVEWHDSLGNVVTKDTKVTIVSNGTTLIAAFKANTYTVTFKNAELDAFSSQKTVTFAETYGTLPTPTKPGYTFDGWYTANTYVTKIEATGTVNTANDHDLYAKWTARTYTVKFFANGSAVDGTFITVTYGERYSATTLAEPAREGYVFKGWYTDPFTQTDATKVTDATEVVIAADHILYAKWEAAPEPAPEETSDE